MREDLFLDLGFYKVEVSSEESGDSPFYYFTFDPVPGISLITNASDKAEKDGWEVSFFDNKTLVIKNGVLLRKFVGVLTEILKSNGYVK